MYYRQSRYWYGDIRSFKLKMITLSSTESEWIVLCEATTLAEWIKSLLLSFDIIIRPIIVRQDNTSAIWLAEHGANLLVLNTY